MATKLKTSMRVSDTLEMYDEAGIDNLALPQPAAPAALVPAVAVAAQSLAQPLTPGHCRWRVRLACPTPLEHRELVVEAIDEAGAREAFCRANNISGSAHPWNVERVG